MKDKAFVWENRTHLLKTCADRGYGPMQTLALLIRYEQGRPEDLQELYQLGLILYTEDPGRAH